MRRAKTGAKTIRHFFRNVLIILLVLIVLALCGVAFLFYRGSASYQVKYGNEITAAAKKEGLSPYLVAGVVKSESDFQADVVAEDGGVGLMQLMPEAVDWVCQRLDVDKATIDLKDPKTNLMIGTHYLSYLISRYQSEHLAIVAYNTGMTNVDKWLKDGTITWAFETMQNVPYDVPRRYVHRVDKAREIYAKMYGDGLPDDTTGENRALLAVKNMWRTMRSFAAQY